MKVREFYKICIFYIVAILAFLIPLVLIFLLFYDRNEALRYYTSNLVELNYIVIFILSIASAWVLVKVGYDKELISTETKKRLLLYSKIVTLLYGVFLIYITYWRFITLRSEAIDVSYFHLTLWQLSEFKIPMIWGTNLYVWGQHFSPILFFLVPIYFFTKSANYIFIIQALVVVSGIFPLYLIAKKFLKSEILGVALSFSYLAFGGIQFGYAYGFHEIMLFPTIFFWLYYFYLRRSLFLYYLSLLLALMVKETVVFTLFFWGIYLLVVKKDRINSLFTILASTFWYVICFAIVIPRFSPTGGYVYWGQYASDANYGGLRGLVVYVFKNPLAFIKNLVTPDFKVDTIFHSFGSFAFLPFFYLPALIIVIPAIMEKLLSSDIASKNGFHYSAVICAVVLVAGIEAIKFIQERKVQKKLLINVNLFIAIVVLFVSVYTNVFYGYARLSPFLLGLEPGLTKQEIDFLDETIRVIPKDASVSAQYAIAPRIIKPYGKIKDGPQANEDADYVIMNYKLPIYLGNPEEINKNFEQVVKGGNYIPVVSKYNTLLFKKK